MGKLSTSGGVHPPLLQIDLVDALVVGKEHIHLAGHRHALRRQGGGDGLPQQSGPELVPLQLRLDENLMFHISHVLTL